MERILSPALLTQRIDFPDGSHRHDAWCPWCERLHRHGATLGRRGAHCVDRDGRSPLSCYELDVRSRRAYGDATLFPHAPLVGVRRFHQSIALSSHALRRVLFTAIFAVSSVRSIMSGKLGRPAVSVSVDVTGDWSAVSNANAGRAFQGSELLSLISTLFAIPQGVAAVRVLEAVTGAQLDTRAALEIAAAIDDWFRRGAPANKGSRA